MTKLGMVFEPKICKIGHLFILHTKLDNIRKIEHN